jgi:hypothetical protein
MRRIGALCERVAFYKPRLIRHLVLTNMVTHQRADVDVSHWRRVVPSLFLSDQQVMGAVGGCGCGERVGVRACERVCERVCWHVLGGGCQLACDAVVSE